MSPLLPSVPTESLHKFFAIIGLLLTFVPFAYLNTRMDAAEVDEIHLDTDIKLLRLEDKKMVAQRERVVVIRRRLLKRMRFATSTFKLPAPGSAPAAFDQAYARLTEVERLIPLAMDSIKTQSALADSLWSKHEVANVRLDEKLALARNKTDQIRRYLGLSKVFVVAGPFLAVFGFVWWYRKEDGPTAFRVESAKKAPLTSPSPFSSWTTTRTDRVNPSNPPAE